MQTTLTLNPTNWPSLTATVIAHVNDAQFMHAGIWQLCHVELTIPLTMAQGSKDGHLQLFNWLEKQALRKRLCATRHETARLTLTFERFN